MRTLLSLGLLIALGVTVAAAMLLVAGNGVVTP